MFEAAKSETKRRNLCLMLAILSSIYFSSGSRLGLNQFNLWNETPRRKRRAERRKELGTVGELFEVLLSHFMVIQSCDWEFWFLASIPERVGWGVGEALRLLGLEIIDTKSTRIVVWGLRWDDKSEKALSRINLSVFGLMKSSKRSTKN
jgi:hypothetical protein